MKDVPNPSKEHNLARERYQETTGSWLLKNGGAFDTWKTADNSLLWLNGGGEPLKFYNMT